MHAGVVKAASALAAAAVVIITGGAAHRVAAGTWTSGDVPCDATALARDIGTASDGEVLNLAHMCVYELKTALPAISNDLTIDGSDATLERSSGSRIPAFSLLTVRSGDVAVSNLNFRNGGSGSEGPDGNTGAGGAIDNEGGNVMVHGGVFAGNSADGGGAIANAVDRTLVVARSVFSGNTSVYGGAIDNYGTARLDHATFTGNTARRWGGGIMTSFRTTLTRCRVIGNTAMAGGGMFTTRTALVSHSAFSRNTSKYNGGAIFNDGTLALRASNLTNNAARHAGGGIFNDVFAQASATGDDFRGNHAGAPGGAIFNENAMTIARGKILGNVSGAQGGGIYTDWVMTVSRSTITGNVAVSGGGIYNDDFFGRLGRLNMTSVVIARNMPDDCEGCQPATWHPGPGPVPRQHPSGQPGSSLAAPGAAQATSLAARAARIGR